MKKRLISIFASLAIAMTMAVPAMAEDTTVTVTFPTEVTNVETDEMITVDFPEAINFNTITTTTVYAEVQATVGTYVTAGDKHNIRVIANGDDSFKIDPSSLKAFVSYKLVIDGVKNQDGVPFDKFTSDEFTTSAISTMKYEENKIIRNIAQNKTITLYNANNEVVTTSDVMKWTDGDYTNSFNFTSKANAGKPYVDHYAVIDLGSPKPFKSIAVQSASAWYRDELGVYLKNDVEGLTLETLKAETPTKVVASNSADKMMHYLELESEDAYQYIVLRNLESEVDLNLREIFAFVQAEYQPITTTVTIPTTVTNVGASELITVEFSDAVDISSFTPATIYAVVEGFESTTTKVLPYAVGDIHNLSVIKFADNKIALDVSNLDSYVSYKIVMNNLLDAEGNTIPMYTSEVFTTGEIAKLPYMDGKTIINVAKNKTITHPTTDITKWVDGNYTNAFNLADVKNYFTIDLGEARKIDSVGAVWHSDNSWSNVGLKVALSNKKDLTEDELSALNWVPFVYANTSGITSYSGVADYAEVDSENDYQYVVFKMFGTKSTSITLRELMVYVYKDKTTASVNLTSTPNAVTNVGTNELIEVTFSGAVNMDTVNTNTVYAICNTDRNPANTGIKVGNKKNVTIINKGTNSFNIDVYDLDGLVDYTLVVDGVEDFDGVPVTKLETSFKTGVIARLPYQEGKIIKNVAQGKTISAPVMTSNDGKDDYTNRKNGKLGYWLDGDVTTNDNFTHLTDDYVLIDLGNKYEIEAMGAVWAAGNWTNQKTQIYLTNDPEVLSETSVGFYWADAKQGCNELVDYVQDIKSVFNAEGGYRYIVVKCSNTSSSASVSIKELCAFGYEEENEMYIAKNITLKKETVDGELMSVVDKITLTAHALRTGESTLILAEYNNDKLVRVIPQPCSQGAAMIQVTPVEGNTYKAFLWNTVTGMTPVIESVEF